ncbi:SufE protein QQinvolved in Fe-S center assembly, partial [Xanthomonas arboricola pv. pruni str. MAFF 311562]
RWRRGRYKACAPMARKPRLLAPAGKGHHCGVAGQRYHRPILDFLMTTTPFPLEPTAVDAQAAIAEEFSFFGDWSERYQYLIDLGRKLPSFPEQWKTEEHRLHGCQSMVWIVPEGNAERLDFHAVSDSAIVSGLIYLALRVYSGRSAQEILATEPDYIAGIGLAKHLSPTRSNGVAAMLAFIRDTARAQQ